MDNYLLMRHIEDKFTRPLTDHQIAEAFPDCRDVAKRNLADLTVDVQDWKSALRHDECVKYFMAIDPQVKQINRLKRYLQLTEPMRDTIDVSKAKAVPIQSLFEPVKAKHSSARIHCCCPFPGHNDKTPSFTIYLNNNTYHCFAGCGGGDSIEFVKRLFNINFIQAVQRLSQ